MSKDLHEVLDRTARFFQAATREGSGQWTFVATSQANQSAGMFLEFFVANRAFTFFSAELHFRNQAAKILVTGAGVDEKRNAREIDDCQLPIAN